MFLVAGATGRVGSVVASELLSRGHRVKVIVRDRAPGRGQAWSQRGAEVAVGSLEDRAFLAGALRGASGFFVLLPEDLAVAEFRAHRRRMAESITAAVKDSGVPHVVLLSAISAFLSEGNGPARELHYLEGLQATTGAIVTTLRAAYLQENAGGVLGLARQTGVCPNLLPSAEIAFPQVAARDVGRFAAAALEAPPPRSEVVDVLGPSYSMRQVAEALGAALGREVRVVQVPAAEHVAALGGAGLPREVAEQVAELYATLAAGRIAPRGERSLLGATALEVTIRELCEDARGGAP